MNNVYFSFHRKKIAAEFGTTRVIMTDFYELNYCDHKDPFCKVTEVCPGCVFLFGHGEQLQMSLSEVTNLTFN